VKEDATKADFDDNDLMFDSGIDPRLNKRCSGGLRAIRNEHGCRGASECPELGGSFSRSGKDWDFPWLCRFRCSS
jgi:hypothetical protein